MKNVRSIASGIMMLSAVAISSSSSAGRPLGHEAQGEINSLLKTPIIKPESGFSAKVLIPPGELYDPLFMLQRGATVLMNDDGKATDGHGSRILEVTIDGNLSVLMDADKLVPVAAMDIAPQGFGKFAGELFTLAQPTTGMKGAMANHVIQRIDLATRTASIFCTLPTAGSAGRGIPGFGTDARFGPPRSAFANVFYTITILNDMIYQTLPDGTCKPFVDLSHVGAPQGMAFLADGSAMLVTIAATEVVPSATTPPKGAIIRITPDGKVDPNPIATGFIGPEGIAVAPAGFPKYAGDIFLTDVGDLQIPVPQGQPLKRDGKVYRVSTQGKVRLVASGFINPDCLQFIGHHLWVTDVNGDFIAGLRELPDGFLVQIDVTRPQ